MTGLLVILVLVLLSVALWQLTKIFDLTQVGKDKVNNQVADDNDNKVNGYLMFGFLGFIYLITIFSFVKYGSFPLMSNAASVHGKEVDNLMWISMILIFFKRYGFAKWLSYKVFSRIFLLIFFTNFGPS